MSADLRIPDDRYEASRIHEQFANEPTKREYIIETLRKVGTITAEAAMALFKIFQ